MGVATVVGAGSVPPSAADLRACEDGSLTVRAAIAFTGLSRQELFERMADGSLDWFAKGERGTRYITRKSLVKLIAQYRAEFRRIDKAERAQPAAQ